jgi:hypothetical protein
LRTGNESFSRTVDLKSTVSPSDSSSSALGREYFEKEVIPPSFYITALKTRRAKVPPGIHTGAFSKLTFKLGKEKKL